MKKMLMVFTFVLSTQLMAAPNIPAAEQVGSVTVEEISAEEFDLLSTDDPTPTEQPKPITFNERMERTGKVIQVVKDLVALGETIYDLVKKGKPSNVTEYTAISVIPRDPTTKEIVDPLSMEGFSFPEERSYVAKVKNAVGKEVVTFSYKVIFSHSGSFNGKGKYLTNVMVVPGAVKTSFGWDFSATMRLSGVMNHGTKDEPVAGALVAIKYTVTSWSAAFERNDTIHVSGKGDVRNFNM